MVSAYLDRPDLNRETFHDGFFYPGDLGLKDERGRLVITGRSSLFIDSGGEKVDPLEIEQALATHPAVKEAAVVGVPGPYGGEAIKAVIVPRGELTEWEILFHCRERLADYKIPRFVEFREALPKGALGKVLRKTLIGDGGPIAPATRGGSPPGSLNHQIRSFSSGDPAAQALLVIRMRQQLAEMLRAPVAVVDPDRPLAELGLGSLMAIELREWLEANLEMTLPVTQLWDYPTIRTLATHLVSRLVEDDPSHDATPRRQDGSPVPGRLDEHVEVDIAQLSDAEVEEQINALAREILTGRGDK
jgi:long-chain acyl-CoA synthetase